MERRSFRRIAELDIRWLSIGTRLPKESDELRKTKLLESASDEEIIITLDARRLVYSRAFALEKRMKRVAVKFVTLKELECESGCNLYEIYAAARKLALRPCYPETALVLASSYRNQLPDSKLYISSEMRTPPDENEMCETALFVLRSTANKRYLEVKEVRAGQPWEEKDAVIAFQMERFS